LYLNIKSLYFLKVEKKLIKNMSEWELAKQILLKLADWGIPFAIGVLFRRRVGRWLVKMKMRLLNDTISIDILSVRSYQPTEVKPCDHQVYENIRTEIPNTRLLNMLSNGLRISVPEFGILKVTIEKVTIEEIPNEEGEPEVTRIKAVLAPECPVTLGVRDIDKISTFTAYSQVLFREIEHCCLTENRVIADATFTILEIPRVGHFREEKSFRVEDSSIGTSIHATEEKLTITVSALTQVGKAAKKYLLA
jgi:hypothetical protein